MRQYKKFITRLIMAVMLLTTIRGWEFAPAVAASPGPALSSSDGLIVKLKSSPALYGLDLAPAAADWLLANYQLNEAIEYVEPNYRVQATLLPNDPEYFRQWYLPAINTPQAWDISQGHRNIVVAVLDTGVDIDHPDLQENIWINVGEKPYDQIDNDNNGYIDDFYGWNFIDNNNNVKPNLAGESESALHHGTVIAGLIGARGNNAIGITGINWQVKVMPLTVLDNDGSGNTLAVTRAIDYAIRQGADVINLSFVGPDYSVSLQEAIARAYQNDIVVVAAAGNENGQSLDLDEQPAYPVCNDTPDNILIGVAAVDQANRLAQFSNYGSRCIDVVAPGTNMFSTMVYEPNHQNLRGLYSGGWSGTSVAAPLVSGLAALIKAVNPNLKAVQIRNIIINTAQSVDVNNHPTLAGKLGQGLIDAGLAVKAAQATITGTISQPVRQEYFAFAPGPGGGPHVRVLDYQGNVLSQWFAHSANYRGGLNIATGDVDGDGSEDIIVGLGQQAEPVVKIFDIYGNLKYQWLAYDPGFRGGVKVAVGDVDGDGQLEIVTSPQAGGGPHVRVFDYQGQVKSQFMAYVPHFRGGVQIAVADTNQDQISEIITGAGPGGGPHVRVFDQTGRIKSEFMAYAENFPGGVEVAVGDIDNDGQAELITAPFSQGGPHVRIFTLAGYLKSQWFAGDHRYRGGLRLALGDLSGNNLQQLIVSRGPGFEPRVEIYDWLGNFQHSLLAYNKFFRGGVEVDVLRE